MTLSRRRIGVVCQLCGAAVGGGGCGGMGRRQAGGGGGARAVVWVGAWGRAGGSARVGSLSIVDAMGPAGVACRRWGCPAGVGSGGWQAPRVCRGVAWWGWVVGWGGWVWLSGSRGHRMWAGRWIGSIANHCIIFEPSYSGPYPLAPVVLSTRALR